MIQQTFPEVPLIEVQNLQCTFQTNHRDHLFGPRKLVQAVSGVDFDIRPGEAFGLVGESGCGKSTTAKLILNMATASEGEVRYRGNSLLGLSNAEWKPLRRKLQYVFQDPLGALDPRISILNQVIEPLSIHRISDAGKRRELAETMLQTVGIRSNQFAKYPHELSGGQRQRVVLARALILEPEVLICDEPISALDVSIQAQIINLLQQLRREMGLTLLFISHDLSVVHHLCDRVAVMYLGRIVEIGTSESIFRSPRHPYTKALISAIPKAAPGTTTSRIELDGEPPSPIDPPNGCRFHPRCSFATARCREQAPQHVETEIGHSVACFEAPQVNADPVK